MATRDQVAQLAGTSPSVVSYVVNEGPRPVSQATRQKVLDAIAQLDYRPNSLARALRVKKTLALGLIVPDSSNPFFAALVQAIEDVAYENGYTLLIGNASNNETREINYVRAFAERQVDGLVLISSTTSPSSLEELQKVNLPVVIVDRLVDEEFPVSMVVADNEAGGYIATEHLLSHGHTKIACLGGPSDLTPSADRFRGWQRATEQSSLYLEPNLLVKSNFDSQSAYEATKLLLNSQSDITALFASTDTQAFGALRAIRETGRRIPKDFAIVSFDDIAESAFSFPPLTTIKQPIDKMAKLAFEMLVQRMQEPKTPSSKAVLEVSLNIRRSCGCCHDT